MDARTAPKPAAPAARASLCAPLDPELLTVREGFMAFVHRTLKPPDPQDCAPRARKSPTPTCG